MTPHKRLSTLAVILALTIGLQPLTSFAQSVDTFGEEEIPLEPTPIEELTPGGEGNVLPGTESLYDQAITVTQIEIQGNKLIPAETILQVIETKPGTIYSKRRLQSDLKKVYDLGYFTENLRVVPVATRDGIHLKIEVEENPVVQRFEFEGETVVDEADLQEVYADQIGKPQNINMINAGIQDVEALYKDKGYILARVEDIREDEPGVVRLIINEGRIGTITFSGNKKTKDYVIRRAMAQKEGEIYNEKTVSDDMRRIFSTQAFSDVRRVIKASPEQPGAYDLMVEVDEKKTGALSLGGGIDTATGVFGSVGYSDPNFMGRGQNISTIFSLGTGVLGADRDTADQTVVQFQANWFTPSIAETANSLGVSLFGRDLASFNVPLAIERRIGTEVTWGRPIERLPGLTTSVGLGYENTNLREGVTAARLASLGITPAQRAEQLEDGSFIYLSPGVAYDSRDNRFNPSQGWLATVGSRLGFGLDTDSYGTITANIRRYLKITDGVTFAMNLQGGGAPFGETPQFNLFRMGGAYTVRGFQEGGVGVGQHFLLGSAEVRTKLPLLKRFTQLPIYDMVQAALFADAGVLFDEADTNDIFDRPGYGISVGAGVRINIPALGPIRVDWAKPLGGNTGRQTRNFNFGVGQKF